MNKYQAYINNIKLEDKRSKCAERTLEMQAAFPELTRVRGNVFLMPSGLERHHWWLKTPSGEIIDPTVDQFSDMNYIYCGQSIMSYVELDETKPEPVGKCMNCGKYSYLDTNYCSNACLQELAEYYNWDRVKRA
jgi:hypothetical protein